MGAIASMTMTLGAGVSSSLDARAQGRAARERGDYEAQVFEKNAKVAELQATDAMARGAFAESKQRAATRQDVGASRAALAAQGVDVNTGSAAEVQGQQQMFGELDALMIRNNAAREAWGYDVDASNQRISALMSRLAGKQEQAAYNAQATSTLLTSGANAYATWQTRTRPPRNDNEPANARLRNPKYSNRWTKN